MGWTQPICSVCYDMQFPGRKPIALKPEFCDEERCSLCGQTTKEGIYWRANPTEVLYPSE